MSFGKVISEARKKANLSQKELAALLRKKEDDQPISPQYLNDLEHDRRNPPADHLIEQFAKHLKIEKDVLYFAAGELPADVRESSVDLKKDRERVVKAYQAFRRELRR